MVVSIVLGYHQDQMDAETALAQKIDVPKRVLVQEFSADAHKNAKGELHILAEAAITRKFAIDVGDEETSNRIDVVPLFPVSRQSLPLARSLVDTKRRPMPRSEAPAVASRLKNVERIENLAVGLMILDASGDQADTPDVSHLYVGEGQNGQLVDLAGTQVDGSQFLEGSADLLAKNEITLIENALVISPYIQERAHATAPLDYSTLQTALFWAALMMITFGFCTMIFARSETDVLTTAETSNEVKAIGAFPSIDPFQPIAGQDELGEEQSESKPQKTSRVMTVASSIFRAKSRP